MSLKYHSGRFEVTDKNGAFSVTGIVEVAAAIKSLFYINIERFDGSEFVSMAFNSLEVRALAYYLKNAKYDASLEYSKSSGGNQTLKTMSIEILDRYFKIIILYKNKRYEISVLMAEMESLGDEMIHLVNECMSNCYKTQQHQKRKKTIPTQE